MALTSRSRPWHLVVVQVEVEVVEGVEEDESVDEAKELLVNEEKLYEEDEDDEERDEEEGEEDELGVDFLILISWNLDQESENGLWKFWGVCEEL